MLLLSINSVAAVAAAVVVASVAAAAVVASVAAAVGVDASQLTISEMR